MTPLPTPQTNIFPRISLEMVRLWDRNISHFEKYKSFEDKWNIFPGHLQRALPMRLFLTLILDIALSSSALWQEDFMWK